MTTTQLISELEKPRKNYPQGVLTWEAGDIAIYHGHPHLVTFAHTKAEWGRGVLVLRGWGCEVAMADCTHSADDLRLLGRVLRELGDDMYFDSIEKYGRFWRVNIDGMIYEGDTLIEAALKALLAKVEGEKK